MTLLDYKPGTRNEIVGMILAVLLLLGASHTGAAAVAFYVGYHREDDAAKRLIVEAWLKGKESGWKNCLSEMLIPNAELSIDGERYRVLTEDEYGRLKAASCSK